MKTLYKHEPNDLATNMQDIHVVRIFDCKSAFVLGYKIALGICLGFILFWLIAAIVIFFASAFIVGIIHEFITNAA